MPRPPPLISSAMGMPTEGTARATPSTASTSATVSMSSGWPKPLPEPLAATVTLSA